MYWRYCGLAIILVALSGVRLLVTALFGDRGAHYQPAIAAPEDNDPESQLAQGIKISLPCVDVATLEMIHGISDNLAFGLVYERFALQKMQKRGISDIKALQTVHGVGEIKAKALTRYIRLDGPCNLSF